MASVRPESSIFLLALFVIALGGLPRAEAQVSSNPGYPRIGHLDRRDPLFSQLSADIAAAHKAFAQGTEVPPMIFYLYTVDRDEDLYTIAARTNLGIDTIASANGIQRPEEVAQGRDLVLPNMPGIFTSLEPRSDLERMGLALRSPKLKDGLRITLRSGEPRAFIFFPDEIYHPIERAYFLGILFRFPLETGIISSTFGNRNHPISGEEGLHTGIDIAAPEGTPVIAARAGRVEAKGFDDAGLGNFIALAHEGGYTTLYGHLSTITVGLNQQVNSGSLIGTVGSTGLSTGPHLHFEVRNEGTLRDPMPLIHGKEE